jgi:hypothetical protein
MKRYSLLPIFLLLLVVKLNAQSSGDNSIKLGSALQPSDAIVREDETVVNIKSENTYTQTVKQVITLNNANASKFLQQQFWFNKIYKYKSIQIRVLNSFGMEVKKYTKKDFDVFAAYDGFSIALDDKVMVLKLPAREYPTTLEIQYEIEANGYITLPGWTAESNTASMSYTLITPSNFKIRYRSLNMSIKPNISTEGNNTIYKWEATNLKVPEGVEDSYESGKVSPSIQVVPTIFEYEGYKGEFNTWADFGKWNYPLYNETNPFNEQRTAEIKGMVSSCKTNEEKINILYDYLKKNFRYVSVQLGIGGFKPFAVKFVDDKKYGDCKALTNYMRNLLAAVGIKAYPALINAGYNKYPADPEFPRDPFNHVILCIPNGKDSTWLECTSKNSKPGFLGTFTEDKNALLLTENGGVLVKTPRSNYKNNQLITHTDIQMNENGGGKVVASIYTTGDIYEAMDYYTTGNDVDEQKKMFVRYLNYKQPESIIMNEKKDSANGQSFKLNLEYDKVYDFKAGSKLFMSQHIGSLCDEQLNTNKERTLTYLFHYPYQKSDTTVYHLPEGYYPESIPDPITLNHMYGFYKRETNYNKTNNTLTVYETLELRNRIIPADEYESLANFFNNVNADEEQKVVLKKD